MKYLSGPKSTVLAALAVLVGLATVAARFDEKKPRIHTLEDAWDFGSIKQGDVVEHLFIIQNTGTDTLEITSTQASCGCTSTLLADKRIAPGAESKLRVVFNSTGKSGHVSKTVYIYSNDPQEPNKMVTITTDITTGPQTVHNGTMASAVHLSGIFIGDCAACHATKGAGHLGKELYEADCAICHGAKADGKTAADLKDETMMRHSRDGLATIIRDGVPETLMPGFSKEKGGPLTDAEVTSILDYMAQTAAASHSGVNKQ